MGETPRVLVVGGGVMGTGIARDLALRGVDVVLLERGDIAAGATGHMHGLLHSGARYAVSDPESGAQCIRENRILRDIAPHCLEETGGLFVDHPEDPPGYFDRKRRACLDCDIPVETVKGSALREREPGLSEEIDRALAVPDATVDPFGLAAANAVATRRQGGTVHTNTEVAELAVSGDEVTGVVCADGPTVEADHVINATGAWAGELAATAGLEVPLSLSKGAMAVTDACPTRAVINRCRPRGEADIVVPRGDRSILGTTDVAVEDPEEYDREDEEIERIVAGLSTVVPALGRATVVDAYWGVRPLYRPPDADPVDTADVTRSFAVIDHAREGVAGLTTVLGGKLTTYRRVAERAVDLVCERLALDRSCRTADTPLPVVGDDRTKAITRRLSLASPETG